ncbi:polyphosphate kinase 1 [Marinoscillum furvescens]|uniref:Polyphosphate kinase n=1 Tax=Marinoscillum furvescens DSM 4134 TaxID=1122208 RepID=A0A3D9KX93_MARFU|nr:polyphosphate kinase 1 [Marinoscillum furvescens]RED93390.1 polyphosphate kinase [Marinoscillum furvescens DSM 4134]
MIEKYDQLIQQSDLISRDLSWLHFNYRVLDQSMREGRSLPDKLKFVAITASNADEFFMIRVGSLYNYLDYGKDRIDYSGLRAVPFKRKLLHDYKEFAKVQHEHFTQSLVPEFSSHGFQVLAFDKLQKRERERASNYFHKIVFPMLTPMVYDSYHTFPILMNNILIFGVVTKTQEKKEKKKMSFIQIPQNLPRFYEMERKDKVIFVPIEEIVREHINVIFKNVEIISATLFRVTRNGDFTLEESEDAEANFIEEMKKKLKTRKTGRVVRLEVEANYDKWLLKQLKAKYEIEDDNLIEVPKGALMDYTGLWQIVKHEDLQDISKDSPKPVPPISMAEYEDQDMFKILKDRDILLHHPYNSIDPLLDLLDQAAEDPNVLSIKLTIYRLAKNSRVVNALLNAAENGKHVSVLFEVKARFDEENNMKEAQRLQKAGCFVIYGVGMLKTHTKLLLIVRREGEKVRRFVHMSSGNYNEDTSRLYTDIGLLSSDEGYANDVQEFFNVITGHSIPDKYENLITAPSEMRTRLIELIGREEANAREGKSSGIVIKINSLQDSDTIMALYAASRAGVPIHLIVRGICCLRPGREGLSENITVRSIVGEYLEHSRIFYFHNEGKPLVYSGSADMMVRSFERRLESLFLIKDPLLEQQAVNILAYNLRDNVNAYEMNEDGSFTAVTPGERPPFNIHKEFYKVKRESVMAAKLIN